MRFLPLFLFLLLQSSCLQVHDQEFCNDWIDQRDLVDTWLTEFRDVVKEAGNHAEDISVYNKMTVQFEYLFDTTNIVQNGSNRDLWYAGRIDSLRYWISMTGRPELFQGKMDTLNSIIGQSGGLELFSKKEALTCRAILNISTAYFQWVCHQYSVEDLEYDEP